MSVAIVERYDRVAIWLHWSIALLILANGPLGYFGEAIEELGWNPVPLHKSLGLTVLALSLLRLAWRLMHRPPALPASVSLWRARLAWFTHACLYVLMIAVPLTGWLRVSSGKYPLTWFGLVDVPKFAIVPKSAEAAAASRAHELSAWAMGAVIVLHLAAALHHQFRLRDALILRMVPARKNRLST